VRGASDSFIARVAASRSALALWVTQGGSCMTRKRSRDASNAGMARRCAGKADYVENSDKSGCVVAMRVEGHCYKHAWIAKLYDQV